MGEPLPDRGNHGRRRLEAPASASDRWRPGRGRGSGETSVVGVATGIGKFPGGEGPPGVEGRFKCVVCEHWTSAVSEYRMLGVVGPDGRL